MNFSFLLLLLEYSARTVVYPSTFHPQELSRCRNVPQCFLGVFCLSQELSPVNVLLLLCALNTMLVLFGDGTRWADMFTLVPAAQRGTRREKSQGSVSFELCQSSQCWSVITCEKGLWEPVRLVPATKGFLGPDICEHPHGITGHPRPRRVGLCSDAPALGCPSNLQPPFLILTTTRWGGLTTLSDTSEETSQMTQAGPQGKEVAEYESGSGSEQSLPEMCFSSFCFVWPYFCTHFLLLSLSQVIFEDVKKFL